ncbi:hypothetical protein ACJIZ3_011817 [Penstemon smallii]|uniref:SRP9 domain-containing protein n=1 Tax=Penstemon smallii TaxID=265156 RepID=A0ABD3UKK6_9LAMI
MVYIASWDDFVEKSVQLFRADPEKTRYAMKYRHCDGKLVLKVTDDKEENLKLEVIFTTFSFLLSYQCIKFKTDQAQDAKKMEKFNNIFFTLMARGPEVYLHTPSVRKEWIYLKLAGKKMQRPSQPRKEGEGNNSVLPISE